MWEMGKTAVEWTGINLLAAQIMGWISANGALGLFIIVGLGVILVFLAAVVLIHKIDRIPITIPYARALVPTALVMAMLILLILAGAALVMLWREGSPAPALIPAPSADTYSTSQPGAEPEESLYGGQ